MIRRNNHVGRFFSRSFVEIFTFHRTEIWIVLSMFFLIRVLLYYVQIHYIRCHSGDGELSVLKKYKALARQLGIETPLVMQSSLVKSPFLTGFFKPAGLIPEGMTVSNGFSSDNYRSLAIRNYKMNR